MAKGQRKIRWGILGVAKINDRLMPAFHSSSTVTLQAIASRDQAKAAQAAKAGGFATSYGSYEALLADPNIDAVYIPLPNSMHAEWTKKAADAGKHVMCEKPLCPTAAEASEVLAYCRAKKVILMDGFMWPHHPRTLKIRKQIDDGVIGEIKKVTGAFTFQMNPIDTNNIRLQPGLGGGSLLDVGCYPVYGIRWAFGIEPISVFARAQLFNGVDVEMTGQLEFPDGRLASFDCGFTSPFRQWMEITGSKGVIRIPEMWLPQHRATWEIFTERNGTEEHAISGHEQMVHMLDDFAQAIIEGREAVPNPDHAVKTLKVLDALAQSAREGRPVPIQ